MKPKVSILAVIQDPKLFGRWFRGESWEAWKAFLAGLFGLPMDEARAEIFRRHTGRTSLPIEPAREGWLVVGRRGGKSLVAALVAVFLACFRDYSAHLGPGERATIMVLAADRRQARTIMRYVSGFFDAVGVLRALVANQTKEGIELTNRVSIEIHTASFRSTRGYTLAAVIADEIAFWRSEESANPDTEIINALRPGLSTISGALLLCISSPYARRGALWQAYGRHYGKDGDRVLVWQADSRSMHPGLDPAFIEEAYLEDEASAAAEYGAEFRRDIEGFVSREAVADCVCDSRRELPYCRSFSYLTFVDPSGGSSDSYTMAIAHREDEGRVVLDVLREHKPPFSPEAVTAEYAELAAAYNCDQVRGDRYAGEWPREQFRKAGIEYLPADRNKSEIYRDLLPLLNSGKAELLDNPRLTSQLCSLERRTARGGRDSIDHAPNAHDDLVNAAAGALVYAGTGFIREPGDLGIS